MTVALKLVEKQTGSKKLETNTSFQNQRLICFWLKKSYVHEYGVIPYCLTADFVFPVLLTEGSLFVIEMKLTCHSLAESEFGI